MTRTRTALVVALGLAFAVPASAQPDPAGGAGQEVELDEDPPPADMDGVAENPNAPRLPGPDEDEGDAGAPPPARTGYPIEEVLRPITLPATMSEISLDVRAGFDPVDLELGLRARYGITRQAQVGLRYLIGGLYEDPSFKFNTGKAFGLDVTYLIFDWLAARVSVPVYVDPVGVGVTIGAPMKFRFGDRFALLVLDDFIDIRVHGFIPSLVSERVNEAWVDAVRTRSSTPNGNMWLRLGAVYQFAPDLALRGHFVQGFIDFADRDNPTGLEAFLQYSPSPKLDLVGRLGIDALDEPSRTFALLVAAAFRI